MDKAYQTSFELLKKGQKIDAVILSIDPDREKIALGLKQLEPDPWTDKIPAQFRLGDEVSGKVLKMTDFGIFLEMEEALKGSSIRRRSCSLLRAVR